MKTKPGPIEFTIHGPMISGQDDIQGRKYRLLIAKPCGYFPKGRRWLVADQESAAENIYAEGGPGSDGFGGATLTFDLVDGGTLSLKGPWKAGADGLFKATGFDCRATYFSRGIVAFERETGKRYTDPDIFRDIIHYDEAPVLGTFDRIQDIAQAAANETGRKVWHSSISKGGGHAGWAEPKPAPGPRGPGGAHDA